MRHFNRANCDAYVRAVFTDKWGRKIVLLGKYAFEYSIYIEDTFFNTITRESFSNGRDARSRFMELKKKRP